MSEKVKAPLPCPLCKKQPTQDWPEEQSVPSNLFMCSNSECRMWDTCWRNLEEWNSLPRYTESDLHAARVEGAEWQKKKMQFVIQGHIGAHCILNNKISASQTADLKDCFDKIVAAKELDPQQVVSQAEEGLKQ